MSVQGRHPAPAPAASWNPVTNVCSERYRFGQAFRRSDTLTTDLASGTAEHETGSPGTPRTIRDTPADLISVELGINLVNTDLMRLRALGPAVHGGRRRFRAVGDPAERAAGKLTHGVTRDELARIVAQRPIPTCATSTAATLYGETGAAELPLPDELNPDAATHRRIGERFAELAFAAGGPFATAAELSAPTAP